MREFAVISKAKFNIDFESIRQFVKNLLNDDISSEYAICSWNNTKLNIKALENFCAHMEVSDEEYTIAQIALYFLFTGRTINYDKLIHNSKKIAKNYLIENDYDISMIEEVLNAIDAFEFENDRTTKASALVQDVTHRYIGKKDLLPYLKELWTERNILLKTKMDLVSFLENKFVEINKHEFQTSFGQEKYEERKLNNIVFLQREIQEIKLSNSLSTNKRAMTMFKTASRNHIDLVNIADKKAGIMISINAILMTLMIPILGSYILDVSRFIIPSIILIITCGITVILATLATRPQIPGGSVEYRDVKEGDKSLWYFGNFFKMEKESYRKAIKAVIIKERAFENSVINDLYDLGHVLGVKYERLRWCYLVFAIGMGLTLLTFGFSFFFSPEI